MPAKQKCWNAWTKILFHCLPSFHFTLSLSPLNNVVNTKISSLFWSGTTAKGIINGINIVQEEEGGGILWIC